MFIPHALLRIDRAPPSSVSLLFCAFTLCILRKYLQTNARKPQRLLNFFKTWVVKDFLRIIWVNIGRIFVGKLGENCQSSLIFCGYDSSLGYDDWRSDKAENQGAYIEGGETRLYRAIYIYISALPKTILAGAQVPQRVKRLLAKYIHLLEIQHIPRPLATFYSIK